VVGDGGPRDIALFVPLGLVVALRLRPLIAWAVASAGSVCCETARLWTPIRNASGLDVTMNSVGAAFGVALVLVVRWRGSNRRERQARATSPHSVQAQ
jgi:VanZ family protein